MTKRDLLTISDLSAHELCGVLERARELKKARGQDDGSRRALGGRVLGLVFEKASTRTRVSFEVGMFELGGHAVYLSQQGSQISRGEPLQDTARVLGGYCHGVVLRTSGHHRIETFARYCPVPVINGLTDLFHPCQVIADLFTVSEIIADWRAARYAWIGDGNNMANSWLNAAALLGLELVIACPDGYRPPADVVARARAAQASLGRGRIDIVGDPAVAATGADVLSTDVWASMGQEGEADRRRQAFVGYAIDSALLARATPDAIVLHCLPAHRGEEIAADVIDGPRSVVWRQAENRLHAQKAVLEVFLRP